MKAVLWTSGAERSRDRAIDYIADENYTAALSQMEEIMRQTRRLLKHPNLGRPARMSGARELSINRTPYIVTYRIVGENVQILHFRHTSQRF